MLERFCLLQHVNGQDLVRNSTRAGGAGHAVVVCIMTCVQLINPRALYWARNKLGQLLASRLRPCTPGHARVDCIDGRMQVNIQQLLHAVTDLNSVLIRRSDLRHIKHAILGPLPPQVLLPQLGTAPVVGQDYLPSAVQVFRAGHCLRLHQAK